MTWRRLAYYAVVLVLSCALSAFLWVKLIEWVVAVKP